MTENRDQLFADLNSLTEEQIEVGLAAGVWNDPLSLPKTISARSDGEVRLAQH
jgi:hypothetical protein